MNKTIKARKPENVVLNADSNQFQGSTKVQKETWDKTKRIREELSGKTVVTGGTRPDSEIFADLYETLITQEITKIYNGSPDLLTVIGEEKWANSLKEYISQSLYAVETVDPRKAVEIGDFHADDNEFESTVVKADIFKRVAISIPARGWIDVFANPKTLESFVTQRITQMMNTWDKYFFEEKMKILLNATGAEITLEWDKTIDLGADASVDIKETMRKARQYILDLETPSKTHIKKNRDKWVYSSGGVDNLVMLVNTEYFTQVSDTTSTLFRADDVIVRIKKVPVAFSLIPGVGATIGRKKFMIIDRRAIKFGRAVEMLTKQLELPTIDNLLIQFNWFGYARINVYPIALFETTS